MKILDLTNLNPQAGTADIISLCDTAKEHSQFVAGVCVFPEYISLVKKHLANTDIKTVTVINFPLGKGDLPYINTATHAAVHAGADEIDLVINWRKYNEEVKGIYATVRMARISCIGKILKVILETGCLRSNLWEHAAFEAIGGGADFLKTSTGKVEVGTTLEAAKVLAMAIKEHSLFSDKPVGLKISGGVRTATMAANYINLVKEHFLSLNSDNFRIGVGHPSQVLRSWSANNVK